MVLASFITKTWKWLKIFLMSARVWEKMAKFFWWVLKKITQKVWYTATISIVSILLGETSMKSLPVKAEKLLLWLLWIQIKYWKWFGEQILWHFTHNLIPSNLILFKKNKRPKWLQPATLLLPTLRKLLQPQRKRVLLSYKWDHWPTYLRLNQKMLATHLI